MESVRNLERIRARVQALGSEARIIAVSKTHPAEAITELLRSGHRDFGENRQSEARDKFPNVNTDGLGANALPIYHHIGPLQSGGARQLPGLFHYVHGASSLSGIKSLMDAVEKHAVRVKDSNYRMRYLIQMRLTDEETKLGGMTGPELDQMEIPRSEHLEFVGFMAMGPEDGDPVRTREVFKKLARIRDDRAPGAELSMGMSQDFEIAVTEGATMIRVGSLIFGSRF